MSIKEARERAGLTQAQVGKKLGITDSAVNQWEAGKAFPNTKRLIALAELYGCTIEDLIRKDEENG